MTFPALWISLGVIDDLHLRWSMVGKKQNQFKASGRKSLLVGV